MRKLFCSVALVILMASVTRAGGGDAYVVFWFDTEDYITPEADDAALRLARILSERGIHGTFKLTGEKARVLEKRGRKDVIAALRRHDIGYHTDFHSVQPAPAVYLERLGWDEGAEEFYRREAAGARDLARILGRPLSSYGQPGNSWAPQTYPALKRMGIAMYLDSGRNVGLDDDMFWYCGVLNFFNLGKKQTRLRLGENPEENLARAKTDFDAVLEQIRAMPGPGTVISVIYHPWEFVEKKAWDAVNFSYGAWPPREKWQPAPLKSREESERDYQAFARYVDFIKSRPGVKFATGTDLVALYPDHARQRAFTRQQVLEMARQARQEVSFWKAPGGDVALSAAEVFSLLLQAHELPIRIPSEPRPSGSGPRPPELPLASARGSVGATGPAQARFRAESWLGPRHRGRTTRQRELERWEIREAAAATLAYARHTGHLPGEVWVGAESLAPEDFMATLAQALLEPERGAFPLATAVFAPARYVAQDAENLWGWLIHPKGLRAPNLMELARLQSWTLKPAILKPEGKKK